MLDENKNVTEASLEVGYGSVSQFARDYRKMFGMKPKEDVASLRSQLKKQAVFMQEQASGGSQTPVRIGLHGRTCFPKISGYGGNENDFNRRVM